MTELSEDCETPDAVALLDALLPAACPFVLRRNVDVSGVSGTGVVADGVVFPTAGKDVTVVRWRGERGSTVVWDNLAHALEVHGHGGATRIELLPVGELIACLKDLIEASDEEPLSGARVRALILGHLYEDEGDDL